jgi:hypothetical protein
MASVVVKQYEGLLPRRANHRHTFSLAETLEELSAARSFRAWRRFSRSPSRSQDSISNEWMTTTIACSAATAEIARVPKPSCQLTLRRALYAVRNWSAQKNLTRRANHRHIFILARILEPAVRENGRGLFQSDGGRIRDAPSPHVSDLPQDAFASAPPSEPFLAFAGVREHAGMRRGTNPRPHAASPGRDRVRA